MGDKTHPKTNMNMKIVFAIALVFIAAVACAHDAEFSETTTPEDEQLDSVAVTESSGDNAQAGWGRRRRRRWRHVAERKLKHSAALLRKHISERKGKERKKKERASKEKQAKIKEKHAKHVAERKGKERKAKELGHKKYMELKSKHNKEKAPQKQEGQSMLDPYVLQTREVYGTPPLLVHQLPQRQTRRLEALRIPEAGRSVQVQAQASQVQDDRQQEQEGLQEIQEDSIQGKEEKVPQAH